MKKIFYRIMSVVCFIPIGYFAAKSGTTSDLRWAIAFAVFGLVAAMEAEDSTLGD